MTTNPENVRILKKLENIYENCNSHSLNETNKLYQMDFSKDISGDYKILHIIGSGSIGQVYKARDLHTDELVAIKVKHYGIEYKYLISYFMVRYLMFLFWLFPYLNYAYLPMDLSGFMCQLNSQLDFPNEAKNAQIMYDNFKDNPLVVIPKIIKSSENIIVMEYVDGEQLNDINASEFKIRQIALYFTLLIYEMAFTHRFLHGDLHKGNWKVMYIDKEYKSFKIVFYDFGYIWKLENVEKTKFFIESMRYNISENIAKILLDNSIKIDNIERNIVGIKQIVSENISIGDAIKIESFMNMSGEIAKTHKLIYNTDLINVLVMLVQIEELCINNKITQQVPMCYDNSIDFQNELNNEYLTLCNMYKYHKDLKEYYQYLKDKYKVKNKGAFDSISYLEGL
jgi:predicted unusual protein kinase regulating ubiquinone biosynthesis (AarF/ABC1/UbiB family)